MRLILLIILILLLLGALPLWPYSAGWGYYPGGGLGRSCTCRPRIIGMVLSRAAWVT